MARVSIAYDRAGALRDIQTLLENGVSAEDALERASRAHAIEAPYETVRRDLSNLLDWAFSTAVDLDDHIADLDTDADIRPEDLSEHPQIPQAFIDTDTDDALACVHYAIGAQRTGKA